MAKRKDTEKDKEYRKRKKLNETPEQIIARKKYEAERKKEYRKRQKLNILSNITNNNASEISSVSSSDQKEIESSISIPSTTCLETSNEQIINDVNLKTNWKNKWCRSILRFEAMFTNNEFGYACCVCDRLWFQNDLKGITPAYLKVIADWCTKNNCETDIKEHNSVCNNCKSSLQKGNMPKMAKLNGFYYPEIPTDLPTLDPISERLISPRLPFMQVRRLRFNFSYGITGQVINVPVDVQEMVKCLPRQLDEDQVININIKKNLAHKSSYLKGYVRKNTIKCWLDKLQNSTLYKLYGIKVDLSIMNYKTSELEQQEDEDSAAIEKISSNHTESEILASRQQTVMWNEDDCLYIAPGQKSRPMNIIYDQHAEELSFPSIYFGEPRKFNMEVSVTPYMIATSEIRRSDRRGSVCQKILYVAMKILRLRMVEGVYNTFRNVSSTGSITRRQLEDPELLQEYIIKNLAFMKTIPNSVQYWASRKRDLFAMMRQLGKPTVFLTISANEIRWMKLLKIIQRLSKKYLTKEVENLNAIERCDLVSEDPVVCCIYFYKMLCMLMNMLKSKQSHNPFGKYYVLDYFIRIEFQHRGSPHAHILLWLNNDPRETVSENMPRTIELIEYLSSVAQQDVPSEAVYSNQVHKHTFTCTKRGEVTCRFNIPYWPMNKTCVLLPMTNADNRRRPLQDKAKLLRASLDERKFKSMEEFLAHHKINLHQYLITIRATLRRPTLVFKRNFNEIMTNTFNPYIAGEVNSNTDIQFILDEYSCAEYVVEYINKSARGMGNLRRELTKMMQENPEQSYDDQLKQLSIKLLNAVEMSAQEAAWYLLRQPMSEMSRFVAYIPTVWPTERQRCRKCKRDMDKEGLDMDSTDIWTKNVIERYESRPADLENVYLAEFAAWYATTKDVAGSSDDDDDDINDAEEQTKSRPTNSKAKKYRRRLTSRIIRYRNYDIDEVINYKREMVLLYVKFRNELTELIDQNKFLQIFDEKKNMIMERRKLYESNLEIQKIMKELEAMMVLDDPVEPEPEEMRNTFVEIPEQNNDDISMIDANQGMSIVKKRSNAMPKQEYCELLRTLNKEQRAIVLEVIHRLHIPDSQPIQIFFTGPAGCGKTYTLKCLMETINRYTQDHNSLNNAYVVCASTGKAAVPLGGTTVHSAFRLTTARVQKILSTEHLHAFRNIFVGVKALIVDEISMLSADILQKINYRLQQITNIYDQSFGGLHVILCGDFRQLPPVRASPCYTIPKNQLGGDVLWHGVNYYPLVRVVRQSDERFSSILTKIGDGLQLNDEEIKLIESRHKTEKWCNENEPNAVRLYYSNAEVDKFNRIAIKNAIDYTAQDIIIGYSSTLEQYQCRNKLHKLTVAETDGLPYLLPLAVGYPYMLTSNIDVADGLVNGAIGTLRHIERRASSEDKQELGEITTLWFEFTETSTGARAKVKCRPYVRSKPDVLSNAWVPLERKILNIAISKTVKCKRKQFSCVPACAITIHKSQGGTFDKVVYKYSSNQPQQLVYVAMSRATSLDGLYIITDADKPLVFKHGRDGNDSQNTRDIRNEYTRLNGHILPTITKEAMEFCSDAQDAGQLLIANMNVQSLNAHSEDIETDIVLPRSDYLVLTETWMRDSSNPIQINEFECVSRKNNNSDSETNAAGGVAIYRNVSSLTMATTLQYKLNNQARILKGIGDVCLAEITCFNDTSSIKFVLGGVYIHPSAKMSDIGLLLHQALLPYVSDDDYDNDVYDVDNKLPILLCGDFNINLKTDKALVNFMKRKFNLDCLSNAIDPTTLGGTAIDLSFSRHITAELLPIVSYFSYHRPVLNRVLQITE